MSMIICDKCRFHWLAKDTTIEELILNEKEGTKMRYFQCPECGAEYIVDITDRDLRRLVALLKRMKKKYIKMYNNHVSPVRLSNYLDRLESVQAEINERHRELKKRWTRGE